MTQKVDPNYFSPYMWQICRRLGRGVFLGDRKFLRQHTEGTGAWDVSVNKVSCAFSSLACCGKVSVWTLPVLLNDNEWLNQVFFQDSSFEGTAGRPDEHRGRHWVVVAWTRGHRQFHVERQWKRGWIQHGLIVNEKLKMSLFFETYWRKKGLRWDDKSNWLWKRFHLFGFFGQVSDSYTNEFYFKRAMNYKSLQATSFQRRAFFGVMCNKSKLTIAKLIHRLLNCTIGPNHLAIFPKGEKTTEMKLVCSYTKTLSLVTKT